MPPENEGLLSQRKRIEFTNLMLGLNPGLSFLSTANFRPLTLDKSKITFGSDRTKDGVHKQQRETEEERCSR
jgi:hypothetical protein